MKRTRPLPPQPLPPDWRQRLERSISSPSRHRQTKEKDFLLYLLRTPRMEAVADSLWLLALKSWDDNRYAGFWGDGYMELVTKDFYNFMEGVLSRVAAGFSLVVGPRVLTVKDFRQIAEALDTICKHDLCFHGPTRKEIEQAIPVFRRLAEDASPTTSKDPRLSMIPELLTQYFRDISGKPMNREVALLMEAVFKGNREASVRSRASERKRAFRTR